MRGQANFPGQPFRWNVVPWALDCVVGTKPEHATAAWPMQPKTRVGPDPRATPLLGGSPFTVAGLRRTVGQAVADQCQNDLVGPGGPDECQAEKEP